MTTTITHPFTGESRVIPKDVTIRQGREGDYNSIIKLCEEVDFLQGLDFHPSTWKAYAADPTKVVAVAEVNKEVVAVSCYYVINNGRHWIGYGARCSPRFQKQNINWACSAYRAILALERYSVPEKLLGITPNVEEFVALKNVGKIKSHMPFLRNLSMLCLQSTCDKLREMFDKQMADWYKNTEMTRLKSPDAFARILEDKSLVSDLLPSGYFDVFHLLFEAIPQSAYDAWNDVSSVVLRSSNGRPSSISFLTVHAIKTGISATISLWGFVDDNVAFAHIGFHMNELLKIKQESGGNISIMMEYLPSYNLKAVVDYFHETLGLSNKGIGKTQYLGMATDRFIFAKY